MEKRQHIQKGKMVMKELMRFKRFYRLQIMCDFFNAGVLLTVLLLLSIVLYKIKFSAVNIPLWFFTMPPVLAAFFSLLNPVKIKEFALKIDRKLGLEQRLITAIHSINKKETYSALLFTDTLNRMKVFEPGLLFPVKWNRAIILLALLTGTLLFYNFYNFTKAESSRILNISEDIKAAMLTEGAQLNDLADRLQKDSSFTGPWEKTFIQKLSNLGDRLQSGVINKRDALLILTDLSSSIKRHYKENTGIRDAVSSDNRYSGPVEESLLTDGEDPVKEVINSLGSAKRHIAESDLEVNKEYSGRNADYGPDTKSLSRGESAPGTAGEAGNPDFHGSFSVPVSGLSGDMGISRLKDEADLSENPEFTPEGIILRYSDSVVRLESLPGKYHRIIIKYFDAISEGKYSRSLNNKGT